MTFGQAYLASSGIAATLLFLRLMVKGGEMRLWHWVVMSGMVGFPMSLALYYLQSGICK